jgi:hypothetical protein
MWGSVGTPPDHVSKRCMVEPLPGAPLGHQPLRNNTKQPSTTSTQMLMNTGVGPAKPKYSRPRLFLHADDCPVQEHPIWFQGVYPFQIRPGDLIMYDAGPQVIRGSLTNTDHYFWITAKRPHVRNCSASGPGQTQQPHAHLFLQFINDNGEYSKVFTATEKIRCYIDSTASQGKGMGLNPKTRQWERLRQNRQTRLWEPVDEEDLPKR